jgi:hypothetical protein
MILAHVLHVSSAFYYWMKNCLVGLVRAGIAEVGIAIPAAPPTVAAGSEGITSLEF